MVAALGETTAGVSLTRLRDIMIEDSEGRRVLKDRPRVSSQTVDMDQLAQYPEGSFGRAYVTWLERCGVTPDTREPVCTSIVTYVLGNLTFSRSITLTTQNLPTSCSDIASVTIFIIAYAIFPSTSSRNSH